MPGWHDSRFTGLFTFFGRLPLRPHDPAVAMTAGEMPPWFADEPDLGCGGAGWTAEESELACLGEAIERVHARVLPGDTAIESSYSEWPLAEPAVDPSRWVLFHGEQYASGGFPFQPLTRDTACRWACCRHAPSGNPVWVPEELVYLLPRRGELQRHLPGFSTGLTCGRQIDPVLLRGLQEVIERDALLGGWWGRYPVEEWPADAVRAMLDPEIWWRVERPNLTYRFYCIRTPFSSHVTLVSQCGEDHEGWVFSVGSACRETRAASFQKSLLEAIQGRHCVRRLLAKWHDDGQPALEVPTTFFEHALYYSLHPLRLAGTILEQAARPSFVAVTDRSEGLADLIAKLGPERPVLYRNLTPPGIAAQKLDWLVLRVVIPCLQPLHGDHRLPFLGGPLWQPRVPADWATMVPHPFA
jgi:ribosomal protein S12 methylthiotransferase accessory factor